MTKVKELLEGGHYHTSYRTDAMFSKKLEEFFNRIPYFKDIVGYDVEGNIVISDDRLTITIIDFGMSSECHTAEIFIKEEEQLIQLLKIEN